MKINNEKGVALAVTLLLVLVLITLSAVFLIRTINEKNLVEKEQRIAKAFYIAEGGANVALDQLDQLINTDMLNTVNGASPQVMINSATSAVAAGDGVDFLIDSVYNGGIPQFVKNGEQAEYVVGITALGDGTYQYLIVVTEKNDPFLSAPDQWDFPFFYQILTTSASNVIPGNVTISGDFTVRIQRDNFAKYALFTNNQTLPNGTNVWFTDKTNFAGPIHTNGRYNIALNPSGTFDGSVAQVEQQTRFYNSGFPILADADSNPGIDEPTFNSSFNRNVSAIALSSSVQQQDMIDQARAGDSTAGNGIFIASSGSNLTGGIYVNGDATVNMGVDGSDRPVYTISQGGTTKIITIDKGANETIIDTGGVPATYTGVPDGVDDLGTLIYVDGNITDISGNIQQNEAATVASAGNIVVQDHIRYSNYTAAVGTPGQVGYVPPSANGTDNLFGMVSWNGDVRIGTAAPDNIDVHGTLLAQNGIFQVDNYNDQGAGPRGTATLLGGVIQDFYGAFGLFSGSTGQQLSGYGRNFVYDERMAVGSAPPYFPSLNTFIAFTNDITDKMIFQEGG